MVFYFLERRVLMKERVEGIISELKKDIESVKTPQDIVDIKAKYIGKSGSINELMKNMKDLSPEERKEVGQIVNVAKTEATEIIGTKEEEINNAILNEKLAKEAVDITLPATEIPVGSANILERVIEEVEDLFMSMGYDVYDGPEIEEDKYNFELLNIPKGHPARDAQDTFYIEGNEILLRSQTSAVQARVMLEHEGKEPIRMICPGRTYRRDEDDATHSHNFTQIEGLLVEKGDISLSDLKGTFDALAKKLFGEDCVTRFRPSYYQFTEPSVETDVSCFACKGKGCSLCKNTGWLTISGAGMVHPNVLRMCGYDPEVWKGFAFGFGAERCAMLKYGISDIRTFYNTDLREVENFDRKEDI
jgi:phenylalanyl-tRNA synthetase alpha chain